MGPKKTSTAEDGDVYIHMYVDAYVMYEKTPCRWLKWPGIQLDDGPLNKEELLISHPEFQGTRYLWIN